MRADEILNTTVLAEEQKKLSVKEYIEWLFKHTPAKARYDFNKGFLMFQDIMDNPSDALSRYRKESQRETTQLVEILKGMKPDPRYTDKEHYLRIGFESRGYSNGDLVLIWLKDKKENLIICARSNDVIVRVRDFLKHFHIIQ
jgi:hypothetical protein